MVGFGLSAAGSALGVYGALQQANGYYAFRLREFPRHLWSLLQALRRGTAEARSYLDVTLHLAKLAGEKRTRSFLGLYWVLAGFLLQMAGGMVSLAASLRGDAR